MSDEQVTLSFLGDEELKGIIKIIADAEVLVSDLLNGFKLKEIGEILKLANDLPELKALVPQVLPEWSQLNDAQRADLVAFVQANCKFPADVAIESYVEKALSALILISKVFQLIKA